MIEKFEECPHCGALNIQTGFFYDMQRCGRCGWGCPPPKMTAADLGLDHG